MNFPRKEVILVTSASYDLGVVDPDSGPVVLSATSSPKVCRGQRSPGHEIVGE